MGASPVHMFAVPLLNGTIVGCRGRASSSWLFVRCLWCCSVLTCVFKCRWHRWLPARRGRDHLRYALRDGRAPDGRRRGRDGVLPHGLPSSPGQPRLRGRPLRRGQGGARQPRGSHAARDDLGRPARGDARARHLPRPNGARIQHRGVLRPPRTRRQAALERAGHALRRRR